MELDQELLTQALVALAALVGGAVGLALTALVLKYAAKWFKDFAAIVRDYTPRVIEQVNEPTDPVNVQLDKWLDRIYPYGWDMLAAKVLPPMLRAAADAIAAQEPVPARAPQSQPQETLRSE